MNKHNDWKTLLSYANKELAGNGYAIRITSEDEGFFDCEILRDGKAVETFAENYYEDELEDLIVEAWHKAVRLKNEERTIRVGDRFREAMPPFPGEFFDWVIEVKDFTEKSSGWFSVCIMTHPDGREESVLISNDLLKNERLYKRLTDVDDTRKDAVAGYIRERFRDICPDYAASIAENILDPVLEDIGASADWSGLAPDEIVPADIDLAIGRVLESKTESN